MDFNVTFESQKQDFSVSLASEDAAFELAGETQQTMIVTMDEDDASFSTEFETGTELLSTEFGEVTVIERGGVRVEIEETETGATITVRDDKGTSVAEIRNGRDGRDGVDGAPGEPGRDGRDGVDGQPGKDGLPGVDGKDGSPGRDGIDGKDGLPGKDGEPGKDGVSVTHKWNGSVLEVTSASGTSSADLRGEQGIQGVQGVQGIQGERGLTGEPGRDGQDGQPGKDGYTPIKGVDYFDGKDGQPGADGKDGYTPQKGVDYWTDADKQEMTAELSGKYLPLSGGTMLGDIHGKTYYMHNVNGNTDSNFAFGMYQWNDGLTLTRRNAEDNAFIANCFAVDGSTGIMNFTVRPTVAGSNIALQAELTAVESVRKKRFYTVNNLPGYSATLTLDQLVQSIPAYSEFTCWITTNTTYGVEFRKILRDAFGVNYYGDMVFETNTSGSTVYVTAYTYDSTKRYLGVWTKTNNKGWAAWKLFE